MGSSKVFVEICQLNVANHGAAPVPRGSRGHRQLETKDAQGERPWRHSQGVRSHEMYWVNGQVYSQKNGININKSARCSEYEPSLVVWNIGYFSTRRCWDEAGIGWWIWQTHTNSPFFSAKGGSTTNQIHPNPSLIAYTLFIFWLLIHYLLVNVSFPPLFIL